MLIFLKWNLVFCPSVGIERFTELGFCYTLSIGEAHSWLECLHRSYGSRESSMRSRRLRQSTTKRPGEVENKPTAVRALWWSTYEISRTSSASPPNHSRDELQLCTSYPKVQAHCY